MKKLLWKSFSALLAVCLIAGTMSFHVTAKENEIPTETETTKAEASKTETTEAKAAANGEAVDDTEPEIFTSGDFQYFLAEDGSATISKYNGYSEELLIPDTLDG